MIPTRKVTMINRVLQFNETFIRRFLNDTLMNEINEELLQYDAGKVLLVDDRYIVVDHMKGAEELFSIGQPVYDNDGKLMGYLGIGLFDNLNYSTDKNVRIPVDYWQICLPTEDCISGKQVFTYWHNEAKKKESDGK